MSRRYRRGKNTTGLGLVIILILLAYSWIKSNLEIFQIILLGLVMLIIIVLFIFILYISKNKKNNVNFNNPEAKDSKVTSKVRIKEADKYFSKELMTECEKSFYNALIEITGLDFIVQPQINLATIIKKESTIKYQNELYRNIDFGIFKKDTYELLLLIEINDKSHEDFDRKQRDKKVKEICDKANIPLITFWLNMPNTKEYMSFRITPYLKVIKSVNSY